MANLLTNFGRHLNLTTRRLSSFNNNRTKSGIISIVNSEDLNIWSENNWTEFGRLLNKSVDFPMPGQTGVILEEESSEATSNAKESSSAALVKPSTNHQAKKIISENLTYLLNKPLPQEIQVIRLREAYSGFIYENTMNDKMQQQQLANKLDSNNALVRNIFELKAFKCPISLLKDFQTYFRSELQDDNSPLTIITVSFKTKNDMATWSGEVESEREAFIKSFVDTAQTLCSQLEKEGYWADFIDPSSGRPAKSPYTHATFYETDERYHQLGFEIIDYGCCKVISHHKWGTKTYVGCLVTTASAESKMVKDLTLNFNAE